MDDGIHANYATSLENGEKSLGNVTVTGGTLEIISADDGIHADSVLSIEGGTVNIKKSYEGLEGNTVNIKGGSTFVSADDDGVNAASGVKTPSINVSGGYLDVTVSAGDTDGIDSNGTYTQTGGLVIVKGGGSFSNVSGALDVDGTAIVTGGTIISLGGTCSLSSGSSCLVAKIQKSGFSAGDYVLQDEYGEEIAVFTLSSSYSSVWICSDTFAIGSSYAIMKDGSSFVSWQQSSNTQSVS